MIYSPLRRSTFNRAYVTFLAGNGDYFKGVIGLAKSLRKVNSAYPLVVALLDDVPEDHRQLLRLQGCILRDIQPIRPEDCDVSKLAWASYLINYSKLRIWLFEEYEKMVYLDADIVVFDNIDHLFDLPNNDFYAVLDCCCDHSWGYFYRRPEHNFTYCQQCPDRNPWPEHLIGEPPVRYFNAGMFVYEPSKQTFDAIMIALKENPPTPFAEQDLLNKFFQNNYTPISCEYNLLVAMLWRHPEKLHADQRLRVVHYCAAGSKPWSFTGKGEHMDRDDVRILVKKWWEIYNDKSLDLYGTAPSGVFPEICTTFPLPLPDTITALRSVAV